MNEKLTVDEVWMNYAKGVASWSKDRSRKTGAVITDPYGKLVAAGWNHFPRGVDDTIEARHERPAKYQWTEHAERNAIYKAASMGRSTAGCRMYLTWYPCVDCARAIIQSGITEIVAVEPQWLDPRWGADFLLVREMISEAGILCRFLAGYSAPVAIESEHYTLEPAVPNARHVYSRENTKPAAENRAG